MTNLASPSPARFEDPLTLFARAQTKLHSLWLRATYPFAALGPRFSVHPTCILSRMTAHQMRIGSSVIIRKDAWLNILTEGDTGVKLIIGDNCLIGARNVISARNLIHVDHDVIIGTSVLIQDHNHAYEDVSVPIREQGVTPGGRIRIEPGCWIGHGAAIVCNKGELVIGRNCVIGANSLVTKSIPPNSVIVGNPGRLARQFDPSRSAWIGGEAGYTVPPTMTGKVFERGRLTGHGETQDEAESTRIAGSF